jgi:hypothetical protein
MIKKTKVKIKRRPGETSSSSMYFSDETQEAIVLFQKESAEDIKSSIYLQRIQPALNLLVENLILVYGFKTPHDSFEELKSDCVSFLYESLNKWSPSKGTKAFSYFNVVAKNWLIIKSRKHQKLNSRHVSIDSPESLTQDQLEEIETHNVMPAPDEILINRNARNEIQELLREIEKTVTSETELTCIRAIITVFKNIDDLDFLNKRAVLIYVRDISGLSSKRLSVAMSSIRKHYKRLSNSDADTGELF